MREGVANLQAREPVPASLVPCHDEDAGATGEHTTEGRPNSATSLTPFSRSAEARGPRFLPRRRRRTRDRRDRVRRARRARRADFGLGLLQIGERSPQYVLVPAPEGDDDGYSLGIYVSDVDAVTARAVTAGRSRAKSPRRRPGDRFASIRDPFGDRWSVMTRVEDLSEEQSAVRVTRVGGGVHAGVTSTVSPVPTAHDRQCAD